MRKIVLSFVVAILLPSLALAWLGIRSLQDQQFLLERQQELLCQGATDSIARNISDQLQQEQQQFSTTVENFAASNEVSADAVAFDRHLRQQWPLAQVGFCVTLPGIISCPVLNSDVAVQRFLTDNGAFLGNRESIEVYWNGNGYGQQGLSKNANSSSSLFNSVSPQSAQQNQVASQMSQESQSQNAASQNKMAFLKSQFRTVNPQRGDFQSGANAVDDSENIPSKVIPAEAGFAELVGDGTDGMLARYLQDNLELMFWHRSSRDTNMIFGAQLHLNRVVNELSDLIRVDSSLSNAVCVALVNDKARPVVVSRAGFKTGLKGSFAAIWKHPYVSTEVGEALPHWEVAAYLVDPSQLTRAVCIAQAVLGLLIGLLMLAIIFGGWFIMKCLNKELQLARQKTDFVSNVSHELKTPLTSIRMFSELLAEGRVADAAKQRSYLNIITAEAARLTRLINNVLDFSHMERGEKKYNFQLCDLAGIVRVTADIFRPHLEADGFKFECEILDNPISVRGDADALSQVIVNLLSNAEKYSGGKREILLQLAQKQSPLPHAEIRVLDLGSGVPRGSGEKIFEKFYRAHDSLSSGIQGSGLGLTIARQIARAHGGDVVYEPREGGGSCFILRLPLKAHEN